MPKSPFVLEVRQHHLALSYRRRWAAAECQCHLSLEQHVVAEMCACPKPAAAFDAAFACAASVHGGVRLRNETLDPQIAKDFAKWPKIRKVCARASGCALWLPPATALLSCRFAAELAQLWSNFECQALA